MINEFYHFRLNRPTSAASTLSYYGRNRPWSSKSSYYGGKTIFIAQPYLFHSQKKKILLFSLFLFDLLVFKHKI